MGQAMERGSPIVEAEGTLQVVNALRRIGQRFDAGHWARGQRFTVGGGACLVGAIDQAVRWAIPGVEQEVTRQLVCGLPRPLRVIARISPRATLMAYNDWPGGQRRARRLVIEALERLGVPAPAEETTDSGRPAGWRMIADLAPRDD